MLCALGQLVGGTIQITVVIVIVMGFLIMLLLFPSLPHPSPLARLFDSTDALEII